MQQKKNENKKKKEKNKMKEKEGGLCSFQAYSRREPFDRHASSARTLFTSRRDRLTSFDVLPCNTILITIINTITLE